LYAIAKQAGSELLEKEAIDRFKTLLELLYFQDKEKKRAAGINDETKLGVVVLIDEYDAPILDHFLNISMADKIGAALSKFYSVIKSQGALIRFAFLTGITRLSQATLFSGLNNIYDLTHDDSFATICGFTEAEFDSLFQEHLEAFLDLFKKRRRLPPEASPKDLRRKIYERYDGYSWDGKTRVLNPWSVINCLGHAEIYDFWLESGSHALLLDLAKERKSSLDFIKGGTPLAKWQNRLDLGRIDLAALMLQTGYLTIKERNGQELILDFPNLEVRRELVPRLLEVKVEANTSLLLERANKFWAALTARDEQAVKAAFGILLAATPLKPHIGLEARHQTALLMALALAGQRFSAEDEEGALPSGLHFQTASRDCLLVGLQHVSRESDKPPKPEIGQDGRRAAESAERKAEAAARLEKEIDLLAEWLLDRLEDKIGGLRLREAPASIWKVALVFGEKGLLKAAFSQAENWAFAKNPLSGEYTAKKDLDG
jgi:hypothetical protein